MNHEIERIERQFWKIAHLERQVQPDLWSEDPEISNQAARYYGELKAVRERLLARITSLQRDEIAR